MSNSLDIALRLEIVVGLLLGTLILARTAWKVHRIRRLIKQTVVLIALGTWTVALLLAASPAAMVVCAALHVLVSRPVLLGASGIAVAGVWAIRPTRWPAFIDVSR